MRRHARTIVIAVAAIALSTTIASCGSDDESAGGPGCSLVDDATASKALGAESVDSADESKDLGGAASNILSCRYTSDGEGPALVVTASQASSAAKAESDLTSTQATCADAQPLDLSDVEGFVCSTGDLGGGPQANATWDGFVVHAAFTTTRSTDQSDPGSSLASVIKDAHERLTRESFDVTE